MIKKIIKSLFEKSEDTGRMEPRPDPPPAPESDISKIIDNAEFIDTRPMVDEKFKPFVQKIYKKWVVNYTKKNHPDLDLTQVCGDIDDNLEWYIKETVDAISEALDTYLGYLESDIDDINEDLFDPYDGRMHSVRNPVQPDPVQPDEVWNTSEDLTNDCACGRPADDKETKKIEKEKNEISRDWNNDW